MDSFKEQSGAVLLPTLLPLSYGHTRLKGRHLRQLGVVGKFVEFFGPGVEALSIADRATISNMCPEYGATVGFFPIDDKSMIYLRQTTETRAKVGGWGWRKLNVCGIGGVRGKSRKGTAFSERVVSVALKTCLKLMRCCSEIVAPMRLDLYRDRDEKKVLVVEEYLRAVKMFRDFKDSSQDPVFSEIVTLDLATVQSSVSGPKRPHDRVSVTDMPVDFKQCLTNKRKPSNEATIFPIRASIEMFPSQGGQEEGEGRDGILRGRRGKGWDSQRKEREGMGFSEQLCTTLDGALFECSPVSRSLEIEVSCLE
uniref:Aconitase/3-isopropylmalate dehydratase large subunit alpha/beta/alpha domain-containing protein n=1 Tax=Timema bartmani TaxID=61472 RepID=A0A7R9F8Y4_9NEOP|nr:unnamed protein product [Timema bartmani]